MKNKNKKVGTGSGSTGPQVPAAGPRVPDKAQGTARGSTGPQVPAAGPRVPDKAQGTGSGSTGPQVLAAVLPQEYINFLDRKRTEQIPIPVPIPVPVPVPLSQEMIDYQKRIDGYKNTTKK
jgi:hypothetical protein